MWLVSVTGGIRRQQHTCLLFGRGKAFDNYSALVVAIIQHHHNYVTNKRGRVILFSQFLLTYLRSVPNMCWGVYVHCCGFGVGNWCK